eukprot:GHVU01126228.1.p1 GENE.GHVU01126228.1~~GHVU01126228.1.p1  ORF type:complete len:478 (+),score=141.28 GHVU01126228.1:343-1776(+)
MKADGVGKVKALAKKIMAPKVAGPPLAKVPMPKEGAPGPLTPGGSKAVPKKPPPTLKKQPMPPKVPGEEREDKKGEDKKEEDKKEEGKEDEKKEGEDKKEEKKEGEEEKKEEKKEGEDKKEEEKEEEKKKGEDTKPEIKDNKPLKPAAVVVAPAAGGAIEVPPPDHPVAALRRAVGRQIDGLTKAEQGHWDADKESFQFVVLADPQFGFYNEDNEGCRKEVGFLTQAVDWINTVKPRFVLALGDMTNRYTGDAPTKDRAVPMGALRGTLARMDASIPLIVMPGNHDVGDTPTKESVSEFETLFGESNYLFWVAGTCFIVCNSCVLVNPDSMQSEFEELMDWIKKAVAEAKEGGAKHIFFACHHPFFVHGFDEDDQRGTIYCQELKKETNLSHFQIPKERRMPLLKLLKAHKVRYSFHGHCHWEAFNDSGGHRQIVTSSVSRPLGRDPRGLRVVEVLEGDIKQRFFPLTKLPTDLRLS